MYGKLEIQDLVSYFQFSPVLLKPEPVDINTKIIFIGSNYLYSMLASYEDDSKKIFKIKADFDYEMHRNGKNVEQYIKVIKKIIVVSARSDEFGREAISQVINMLPLCR